MAPSLKVLRAALTGQPTVEPTPTPAAAHGWLKLPERTEADVAVKPAVYLPIYESLLAPLRDRPLKILELGVWGGDSLIMWRDSLPQATIVGVDLVPPDVELGPRVHIIHGNQTDGELMSRLRAEHAPAGFDVIIDDASHLGITTARSLQVLYAQHLRAGGIYIIEDWGTGYVGHWHDGETPTADIATELLDQTPTDTTGGEDVPIAMPSHDIGMVGLIKRLVDHTASTTLTHLAPDQARNLLAIESLQVHDGIVVLRKPAG